MSIEAIYTAESTATGGGRDGHVKSSDGKLDLDTRPPKEMGGSGEGVNPELLFSAGYAACFLSALRLVAKSSGGGKDAREKAEFAALSAFCQSLIASGQRRIPGGGCLRHCGGDTMAQDRICHHDERQHNQNNRETNRQACANPYIIEHCHAFQRTGQKNPLRQTNTIAELRLFLTGLAAVFHFFLSTR